MIDYGLIVSLVIAAVIIFILGWGISWVSGKMDKLKYLEDNQRYMQERISKLQERVNGR